VKGIVEKTSKEVADSQGLEEGLSPPLRAVEIFLAQEGPEGVVVRFGSGVSPVENMLFLFLVLSVSLVLTPVSVLGILVTIYFGIPLWVGALLAYSRRTWALTARCQESTHPLFLEVGSAAYAVLSCWFLFYVISMVFSLLGSNPLFLFGMLPVGILIWWIHIVRRLLSPKLLPPGEFFLTPAPSILSLNSSFPLRTWKNSLLDLFESVACGLLFGVAAFLGAFFFLQCLASSVLIGDPFRWTFLGAAFFFPLLRYGLRPYLVSWSLRYLAEWSAQEASQLSEGLERRSPSLNLGDS
jgi:hypothetical protein